jgi:aspartate racemase
LSAPSSPSERPPPPPRPQHIGIVACSAEGAALCYRTICIEGALALGPHAHPEVSLHGASLADYMQCMGRGDWRAVAQLMLGSARKLADTGADFLICPDNTIHRALTYARPLSPLPWVSIAETVAGRAAQLGYRRVALTGTRWLVESDVYPQALAAHGIACERPNGAEIAQLDRIILDELVYGESKPESTDYILAVIARMKALGCDAVVLGCTEIPLIVDDSSASLPTLDSTRLLARAALARALGRRS